jgi:hypothetical protein
LWETSNTALRYTPKNLVVWGQVVRVEDKSFAGTCRELRMTLTDGSVHTARFQFSN